jgi:hypothetical protein
VGWVKGGEGRGVCKPHIRRTLYRTNDSLKMGGLPARLLKLRDDSEGFAIHKHIHCRKVGSWLEHAVPRDPSDEEFL